MIVRGLPISGFLVQGQNSYFNRSSRAGNGLFHKIKYVNPPPPVTAARARDLSRPHNSGSTSPHRTCSHMWVPSCLGMAARMRPCACRTAASHLIPASMRPRACRLASPLRDNRPVPDSSRVPPERAFAPAAEPRLTAHHVHAPLASPCLLDAEGKREMRCGGKREMRC